MTDQALLLSMFVEQIKDYLQPEDDRLAFSLLNNGLVPSIVSKLLQVIHFKNVNKCWHQNYFRVFILISVYSTLNYLCKTKFYLLAGWVEEN